MAEAKGRDFLDTQACSTPGCDCPASKGMVMSGRCHPARGVEATYAAGVMTVRCNVCKKLIVRVAVADQTRELQP